MDGRSRGWQGFLGGCGLVVMVVSGGCEPAAEDQCTQPGLGSGPCCVLVLPDGARLQAVCLGDRCVHADQPGFSGPCDGGAPDALFDGRLLDGAPTDAEPLLDVQHADGGADDGPDDDDAAAADAMVDRDAGRCAAVLCEPGERCDPETGECVSRRAGLPGTACVEDADCLEGRCLTEEASDGAVPGGFCSVPCVADAECAGGACLDVADGRVCFEPCDDVGGCRAGWVCAADARPPSCRVDCRVAGCPGQGRCAMDTGLCSPPEVPCPAPCAVGESCEQARCVRLDGSCDVPYHCPPGQTCHRGACAPEEFTPCAEDRACGDTQTCAPTGDGGACLFACAADDDCPIDRSCDPDIDACVRTVCGPDVDNGAPLEPCAFGVRLDRPGTCVPFQAPDADAGVCLEAGLAEAGDPCDAQGEGRSVADRTARCAAGLLCFGDPDDPLRPADGRGRCAPLCAPGDAACPAEQGCVDFGTPDDPSTPDFDGRTFGLCLPVQCEVDAEACAAGEVCRPYALTDRAGVCATAGDRAAGEPCDDEADCADEALCVSRGQETICLPFCDPRDPAACGGGRCYVDTGWAFGICL